MAQLELAKDGLLTRKGMGGISLQVGDVMDAAIQKVEMERGRISLSWQG